MNLTLTYAWDEHNLQAHNPRRRDLRCARARAAAETEFHFILADDHAGYVLGADGNRLERTSHLDAFARESVRFSLHFCNSPVCTPSRQSLFTGQLPHSTGVTRLPTPLAEDKPTLAKQFRRPATRRRFSARCISTGPALRACMDSTSRAPTNTHPSDSACPRRVRGRPADPDRLPRSLRTPISEASLRPITRPLSISITMLAACCASWANSISIRTPWSSTRPIKATVSDNTAGSRNTAATIASL
jgi:hypothetical protein